MADLLSYALTTLADVKESLGIDAGNTSKDNLIKRKINQATEMIEGWCSLPKDHHFKQATYTDEEYDATRTDQLVLRMSPVSTLSSFQVRNTAENNDDWDSVDSDLYFLDEEAGVIDLLQTVYGRWNRWRATYIAGYSTIPSDLAEACVILAGYLVENASSSGAAIKKKQEGQRSIEYHPTTQGGSVIEQLGIDDMINRYVRYPLQDNV